MRAAQPTFFHLSDWKPATVQNIKTMLGLLFTMGLVYKPDLKSYWSTNPILETPIFQHTVARNRFLALFALYHIAYNEEQFPRQDPNFDKLNKIMPFLDHFNKRFPEMYYPQQQLAVDKRMMSFCGRVEFCQHLPSKPIRYGMKLYMCCQSTSGYILKNLIYQGANTTGLERGHYQQVVRMVTAY